MQTKNKEKKEKLESTEKRKEIKGKIEVVVLSGVHVGDL